MKDADGNEYKTVYFDVDGGHDVAKDGQCWMAENLNVGTVILNPDQEPSDDGVIEKWCMTSDEKVISEKNPHCFAGGGGGPGGEGLLEAKKKLKCNNFGSNYKSDDRLCDGSEGYEKYGGLYSFNELKNNRDSLCPEGWKVPNLNDWEIFFQQQKESMRVDGEFYHNAEKYREQAWDDMYFDGMETDPFGLEYFDRDRNAIYKHVEKNDVHNYCVSEEMRYGEFAVKMGGKL